MFQLTLIPLQFQLVICKKRVMVENLIIKFYFSSKKKKKETPQESHCFESFNPRIIKQNVNKILFSVKRATSHLKAFPFSFVWRQNLKQEAEEIPRTNCNSGLRRSDYMRMRASSLHHLVNLERRLRFSKAFEQWGSMASLPIELNISKKKREGKEQKTKKKKKVKEWKKRSMTKS